MMLSVMTILPLSVSAEGDTWDYDNGVYKISTYADLLAFKAKVDGGTDFSGKTVTLEEDIVLENSFTAIGPNSGSTKRYFSGTFDGQGHTITFNNTSDDGQGQYGLFRRLKNATIKNLKLDGTTTIGNKEPYAGSVAMETVGTCVFQNIHSSVNFSANQDAFYVGGLLSYVQDNNSTLTIDGCVYDGRMNFPNMVKQIGGFVGYSKNSGQKVTIKNSVYAGTIMLNDTSYSYQVGGFVALGNTVEMTDCISIGKITFNASKTWTDTEGDDIRGTLIGEVTTATLTNVYYADIAAPNGYSTTALPAICKATNTPTQTKVAVKTADEMVALTADDFSTNTGLSFKAAEGEVSYYPCPTALIKDGKWLKCLTRGLVEPDLVISTSSELQTFATNVNNGNTYEGKLVVLGADIDLTGQTWGGIGVACSKNFSGTFDGQGYTVNIGEQSHTPTGSECNIGAMFNSVQNATLKNVNVTGSMTVSGSAKNGTSGFCAYTLDTVTIENVHSSVYIRLESEKTIVGGIVAQPRNGNAADLTIDSCVFDGTLNFVNYAQKSGGILGYTGQNGSYAKTITIKNCVFAGNINLNDPAISYEIGGFIGQVYSNGTSKAVSITLSDNVYLGNIFYAFEKAWEKTNYHWGAFIGGLGADYEGNLSNAPGIKTVNANNLYYVTRKVPGEKNLPVIGLCATTIESLGANVVNASAVKTKAEIAALNASNFSDETKMVCKGISFDNYYPCPAGLVPAEGWLDSLTDLNTNGAKLMGAQIRCVSAEDAYSGIRFVGQFKTDAVSNAATADANFGVILMSKANYESATKTIDGLVAAGGIQVAATKVDQSVDGFYRVNAVVYGIDEDFYDDELVAICYIDGALVNDAVTRSIYTVAKSCVADTEATDAQKTFCNGIIACVEG